MGWQLAAGLNVLIAACYVLISGLIVLGLVRTKQMATNPLAVATAAIFASCAAHHGLHAAHLITVLGDHGAHELVEVRNVFGQWPMVVTDLIGAGVAVVYLGLRRSYKALLNTPAMFDDAVRVATESHLRELAFTDALSGLPNRSAYQVLADSLVDDERPATVLFLDLDDFKRVNDSLGHETGDRLLHDVAQRLRAGLREQESVFRIGGDEFLVVALAVDAEEGHLLADRVRAMVPGPLPVRGDEVVVRASVGIATGRAFELDQLVRDADASMYRVKAETRRRGPGVPTSRTSVDLVAPPRAGVMDSHGGPSVFQ